jgi:hypothetical protein
VIIRGRDILDVYLDLINSLHNIKIYFFSLIIVSLRLN